MFTSIETILSELAKIITPRLFDAGRRQKKYFRDLYHMFRILDDVEMEFGIVLKNVHRLLKATNNRLDHVWTSYYPLDATPARSHRVIGEIPADAFHDEGRYLRTREVLLLEIAASVDRLVALTRRYVGLLSREKGHPLAVSEVFGLRRSMLKDALNAEGGFITAMYHSSYFELDIGLQKAIFREIDFHSNETHFWWEAQRRVEIDLASEAGLADFHSSLGENTHHVSQAKNEIALFLRKHANIKDIL